MRYLYLLTFFFASITSFGQTSWLQKSGPLGGEVTDVEYYPGTSTVWGLVNGRVYKSINDGASWTRPANATFDNNTINDIEIANNTIYFLSYDRVYTSTDQGVTIASGPQGQFFSASRIKRLPSSGGLVILSGGGSPDIYYSTNNGTTWTAGYNGTTVHTGFLTVNNLDQVFILVRNGATYRPFRSTDGGQNFTEQSTNIPVGDVFSLTAKADGSLLACVNAAGIYTSTNGASWTAIKGGQIVDPTIASFSGVSFVTFTEDNLGMYFLDNQNSKIYSKAVIDAAGLWAQQASDFPVVKNGTIWPAQPTNSASSNNFPAISSKIVFGTSLGIFRSSTGGGSNPETSEGIAEIQGNETIAATNGSLLMNTFDVGVLWSQNSGDSWTRVTSVPFNIRTLTNVMTKSSMVDGSTQLILGNNGLVYYSISNGQNWTQSTQTGTFSDLQGGDNNRAFALTGSSIYYSADGGQTFAATPVTITGLPTSFTINDMYVPTTTALIYVYLHNGITLTDQYYKITPTYNGSNVITAASASLMTSPPIALGNASASNGKLYIYNSTTDQISVYSGTSWSTPVTVPNASSVHIAPNNGYIFIAESGSPGKMHMSKDDWATFTTTDLPTAVSAGNIEDVTVSPQDFVFLTTYRGYMYQSKSKVVLPAVPTALTEVARLSNAYIFRWTDNATNETSYRILRSSDGGTNYSVIGTINDSDICGPTSGGRGFFTDNTVVAGATYKYKLVVINEAGQTESAVLTTLAMPAVVAQNIPDNRSWVAQNSGVQTYPVKPTKVVGIQHMGNGKYTVSDISIGTFTSSLVAQEFYVNGLVTAVGGSATSSSFNEVRANGTGTWTVGTGVLTLKWLRCDDNTSTETITYTLQANDPAPDKPVLQAVISGNGSVELTWASMYYAKNYIIERSITSASTGFTQLGSNVAYPGILATDNTVAEGTTYYYRMKARNGNAAPLDSPYSDVVTIPFKKPNFVVSATTVSSYVSATIGSYWGDFDNDGSEDLLTINGTINGVELATATGFKNLGNGDFEVKAVALNAEAYNFGAVADFNGDGKMDLSLALAEDAQVDFYKGNGDFTFTKLTATDIGELASAVKSSRQGIMWGDINNDGRLDVVISGDYNALLDDRITVCVQNANGTFTSIHAGDLGDYTDDSFSTFWIDYNNDGYSDILVSGSSPLLLYKNNGDNTFRLVPQAESGISLGGFIGLTVADFNNDGFMDIYAGGGEGAGSVIYQNDGDGSFTLKDGTVITEPAFVISPAAGDINNDGLIDLLVPGFFGLPTKLFINNSTGSTLSFNAVTTEKINDMRYWHLGTAFGDYNKDGFIDVAMGSLKNINSSDDQFVDGENYLFKNNNSTGSWSEIKLIGVTANKNGLGARITVTAGGKSYSRELASGSSFVSLSSLTQHFGLGSASSISSIQVKWPTTPAAVQVISNPAINTILTITQDTYAPAITTRVPAIGATGIATTTKLELTFNEGTTAVGGKVISIKGTGDLAAAFNIDAATATIVGNKFTYTLPGSLIENKHYDVTIDAGAFTDQFQNMTAVMNDWSFTTTNVDAEAPKIENVSSLPASVDKATLASALTVKITDNKAVTTASLWVKPASGGTYREVVKTQGTIGTDWSFALAASDFDAIGIQYYFTASDGVNVTRSPAALTTPSTYKTQVKYNGTEAQVPAGLIGTGGSAASWKVIAVPFDLGANNGVQTVFNELTGTNKVDYRIVTYTETPSPAWQDYIDKFSTIDRGIGYLINVKLPVSLVVGDGIIAPPNSRDNLFKINLKAGWNMIGNPYLESINWADVVAFNSITGTGTTFKKFANGGYDNATSVSAYEGGFVHMDANLLTSIPFSGQTSGRIEKINFGTDEWLLPMIVQQGEITNTFGGVGMHSKALMSFDALDDINGPRWFEFVEMNFSHPEHPIKNFARDVVPVSPEFVWAFEFDSNIPGIATLKWDSESYAIGSDLYLYDEDTQTPVDMKETGSYSFDAGVSRNFKIFYGPNALSKIKPSKVMLGLAHPNPASNAATIGFSIPERNGKMSVRLDVFDLTGRRVGTLANGEFEAGFYSTQWQPNEGMSDGLYVYRLFAGDEILGGKIILRK